LIIRDSGIAMFAGLAIAPVAQRIYRTSHGPATSSQNQTETAQGIREA
jgi:hypothetical protein